MAHGDQPDALSKYMVGGWGHWIQRGIPPGRLRTLIKSGDLVQLRRGSYATRSAVNWAKDNPRRTHVLHVYAAMDNVGADSVASHQSAAVMHDIDLLKDPGQIVSLTVPPGHRRVPRAGRVILHIAALSRVQLDRMYRVPVTSPARTVADLARTLPFMEAVVVADSALHKDLIGKEQALFVLESCAAWPGASRARRVIEFANGGAESALESCGRVILAERGVEAPEVQHSIEGPGYRYSVDLYYAKYKTIVEFDGMVKYETKKDLRDQFKRDRILRDAGYQVIHVTWEEVFRTPELLVERIRKAFAAVTAFLGPGGGRCSVARGSSPVLPGRAPGQDLTP